jgi:excinuclease ABC subunit C
MVVFSDGLPDNRAYRHFKMRTKGPNDFAMMRETLSRRFNERNKSWPKPDLIIVDGGKGQLSSARDVLKQLKVTIPVVGLAKRYETLVLSSDDYRYISKFQKDGEFYTLNFENDSALLHLLQRIRDEAHRFAVSYHTKLRSKRTNKSILDEIAGLGPVTKKKLLRSFGSLGALKQASESEIAKIVGPSKAKTIIAGLG